MNIVCNAGGSAGACRNPRQPVGACEPPIAPRLSRHCHPCFGIPASGTLELWPSWARLEVSPAFKPLLRPMAGKLASGRADDRSPAVSQGGSCLGRWAPWHEEVPAPGDAESLGPRRSSTGASENLGATTAHATRLGAIRSAAKE